jgi:hypothetical protein
MNNIKNLLQQVSIIQKKYDDLAEYSGEHYNVFDILGVRSDELSHSAILTNLLDAKGKHGQKDIFLKLFIETVKIGFENDESKMHLLNSFNIGYSKAEKEKFAGKVNYEAEQGGRIDIIINDGKNNIIIENKVYAGDQPLQLVRYNEYDKNAPILYLTLDGKEASENSKGNLRSGYEYVCISYQIEIVLWLEKCIKEMANKPIIRETLNQYLFLIKSLTNQSNNNKMSEEILNIILKDESNFQSTLEIIKYQDKIKIKLIENTIAKLERKLISLGFENISIINFKVKKDGELISFDNKTLRVKGLKIRLNFESNSYSSLLMGFYNSDIDNKILRPDLFTKFKTYFPDAKESGNYPSYIFYKEYENWWSFDILEKINFNYDYFEKDFMSKINQFINIL